MTLESLSHFTLPPLYSHLSGSKTLRTQHAQMHDRKQSCIN
ncbi:hypothetical protein VP168E361_P0040 [Vibrio phage 168E36-1]|nr:hypothetical protein VP168E361_P0040 [Vibrio phage 168E36-1]